MRLCDDVTSFYVRHVGLVSQAEQLFRSPLSKIACYLLCAEVSEVLLIQCVLWKRRFGGWRSVCMQDDPASLNKKGEGQNPWIAPPKIKLNPTTEVTQAMPTSNR